MDFQPDSASVAIQEAAREFALRELAPDARDSDERAHFDRSKVKRLGDAGILGGPLSRRYGGQEWSAVSWVLAQEELGAVDSSWRGFCTVQVGLCGKLLETVANEAQKARYLPELTSGRDVFAYALTEPEAGTDVSSLRTHAQKTDAGYLITGTKHWITNGGVADHILVFATVDPALGKKGVTCFIVPGDAAGLTRSRVEGEHLGHRGADHAVLQFDQVLVPDEAVVGQVGAGFETAMVGLLFGRLSVAAGAVGIQRACEDACLEFSRTRRQFARRIGDFQLVQEVLTDLHVGLAASRLLTLKAAWMKDNGLPNDLEVAVAKYAACEAAVKAADQAILLHAARGYTTTTPVSRHYRDAKGLQIYEGTAHIQRIIIARHLLGKETA